MSAVPPENKAQFKHDAIIRFVLVRMLSLLGLGLGLWCLTPLSTIFQLYIVSFSFIGGGNGSTRRRPPIYCTCCKSLTIFIT